MWPVTKALNLSQPADAGAEGEFNVQALVAFVGDCSEASMLEQVCAQLAVPPCLMPQICLCVLFRHPFLRLVCPDALIL